MCIRDSAATALLTWLLLVLAVRSTAWAGVLLAVVVLVVVLGSLWAAMMPIISALIGAGTSILLILAAAEGAT